MSESGRVALLYYRTYEHTYVYICVYIIGICVHAILFGDLDFMPDVTNRKTT